MRLVVIVFVCIVSLTANADKSATLRLVSKNGVGKEIGKISFTQTKKYGVLITPSLTNLPGTIHGFHIHENPSCAPGKKDGVTVPALAAGGHYDPDKTNQHLGPYREGHLGDLPVLIVNEYGTADMPLIAPRLTIDDLTGKSIMIHAGGDNYSDTPRALGGGGARYACGVIE